MDVKYRIRKRTGKGEQQYYVDYKRVLPDKNIDEIPWMGGFYAETIDAAQKIIREHSQYEELKERFQMEEEIIYDETEEKK